MPQFAFHSEQRGCVRIVAHQCWVVGQEKQPIQVPPTDGAACGRCHGLGTVTPNQMMRGRNVVRRLESHVDSEPLWPPTSPPEEVIRALEADLCSPPRATRRVMLILQSQGGTPSSIQDARERRCLLKQICLQDSPPVHEQFVALILVSNSQEDGSTAPSMDTVYNSARSPQEALGDVEDSLSDTATVGGVSEAGEGVPQEFTLPQSPIIAEHRTVRAPNASFAALSEVDLKSCFTFRACVMRTVTHIMKGAFRLAIRAALEEILEGHRSDNDARMARGWKLFMLLPRMLLFRPRRGGLVPRKIGERVRLFQEGQWLQLLEQSLANDLQGHQVSTRRRRRPTNSVAMRAERAKTLVQFGELSAARVALEGAEVAPGTLATLRELTNPERRPPFPRHEVTREVADTGPAVSFTLDQDLFLISLRTARRGAAGGPSGMTADHLFPVLDNEGDSALLAEVGSIMSQGKIPDAVMEGIRLGRSIALQKPDGGVRGIVVGDIMRRLVARTKKVEKAAVPFQHALTTEAGCECVAHILQTIADKDERATVVSIDGVGAYDLISRNSMIEGLLRMEDGDQVLPFVRCPSTYLWEDELGKPQDIPQGEGGEQGDPFMPLLFALGLHRALSAVQARLSDNEKVFAYLDDIYVICAPERVLEVHRILEAEILTHTQVRLVWNRGGVTPVGVELLTRAAQAIRPEAIVWRGNSTLDEAEQGVKILGIPVGQPGGFWRRSLKNRSCCLTTSLLCQMCRLHG